ncbi:tRNA (adenine(37)-N6)-methyltransferase [Spea bombifrons]|uniref:tRNA (adenine(37)-N6)-methyltransferase n=1 Tax=Spea bombifrons TaxID=233779 RepID=UPI002349176F|nr:tRNA (adenine(37)-N6)-methyltransferase [Spea bombifrons]
MPVSGSHENNSGGSVAALAFSLESGNVLTKPIGYIESCFKTKNGTPRQPSVCSLSRACLRISKNVFNNPEHSLMGLEEFSHVWILFVFHKNGRLSCKAKVQPPRLNGAKTGVFSTRSPHRPNAIGLTLARLEKVEGGTLYLSGIDMIQGTPVLDIKPYISEYDSPKPAASLDELQAQEGTGNDNVCVMPQNSEAIEQPQCLQAPNEKFVDTEQAASKLACETPSIPGEINEDQEKNTALEVINELPPVVLEDTLLDGVSNQSIDGTATTEQRTEFTGPKSPSVHETKETCNSEDSFVPIWVKDAPVANLKVRFTPHSEMELRQFKPPSDSVGPSFTYFKTFEEAKCAISTVLTADPRSVYRRKQCQDRLFYFSLDTLHITCWFGDGFTEVLRIQPLEEHLKCQK